MEEQFRAVLPEVELHLTPADVARLAAGAMAPRPEPVVELTHLHGSTVSLSEQVTLLADRLRRDGAASFRVIIAGTDRLTAVVRFLAVLELYRAQQVSLEQISPLGELTVRWIAGDQRAVEVTDDYGPQPELEEA